MKYMGSKGRIAKDILPFILKNRSLEQCYVEPFVGGCNSIDKVSGCRMANDINPFLIAMWKGLQQDFERPDRISKELYNRWRLVFNENRDSYSEYESFMIGWIGFMGSFNGRFYDGGYSGHNVNGRNYIAEQIRNTESQIQNIKGIHFTSSCYDTIAIPDNSIIYCDIPYRGTKQYLYSKRFDYSYFWDWARTNTLKGHHVFISEYSAPSDFVCIWTKKLTNSLNPTKTYKATECLFVHHSISDLYDPLLQ